MSINSITEQANGIAEQATPLLKRATEQASALAHQGIDSLRSNAQHATDSTVNYIREQPVKSMLIAAASGAALLALANLISHSRHRG